MAIDPELSIARIILGLTPPAELFMGGDVEKPSCAKAKPGAAIPASMVNRRTA